MSTQKTYQAQAIFERFYQANPAPTTELIYHSQFELLIAVILSAQATDKIVNQATSVLFKVANTPESLLAMGEEQLKHYIKSINFYPTKASNIIKTCSCLVTHHQGKVPGNRAALESLPGVGRKTANVVLNVAFGQPVMAVDTHIFRVSNRTGLATGSTPYEVEKGLQAVIPEQYQRDAHHWLILHGRYVCKARQPKCQSCLIAEFCAKN